MGKSMSAENEIRDCEAAMSNAFENRKKSKESRSQNEKENDESSSDDGNENHQEYGTRKQDSKTAAPGRSRRKIIPTKKVGWQICNYCSENFVGRTKSLFENHVNRCKRFHQFVKGENSNQCGLCSKEFLSNGTLLVHIEKCLAKAKTPEKKTCEVCELEVPSHMYNSHVKSSGTCQKYKGLMKGNECIPCKKGFPSRNSLLTHLSRKSHLQNQNAATAKPKENASQHSSILVGLECPNCRALFENEELLLEHIEVCSAVAQDDDDYEAPSLSSPAKECTFCGDHVPHAVLRKHLLRCRKAAELITGVKCNKCPQLQFTSKRETYPHVLKIHIPNDNDNETADETMDENMTSIVEKTPWNEPGARGPIITEVIETARDLDENMTSIVEKTPRHDSGAGGPIITEVVGTPRDLDENMASIDETTPRNDFGAGGRIINKVAGTPRQPFRGETAMVRRDYYVNYDPNVITQLLVCPLCNGKLARKDHADRHLAMYHKIDRTLFRSLKLGFSIQRV